jgi:spore maturation protein CgeB
MTAAPTILFNLGKNHPALADALAERGMTVLADQWQPTPAQLQGCVAALVDAHLAVRQLWRSHGLRRRLRAAGVPLILVDRDAPWHKGLRPRRLAAFHRWIGADGYTTHSLQGCANFPYPALYLPNAARLDRYHLHGVDLAAMRDPAWYRWDLAFIGNIDAERHPEHHLRVARLRSLAERLTASGLRVRLAHAADLAPGEDVEIIQKSRINLQLGAAADDAGPISWGLPERCYGIPACGGFLLADRRLHAADDFRLGGEKEDYAEYVDFAASPNDAEAERLIRHYLADLPAARTIAEAAHRRVLADHTYAHRAARLLDFAAALQDSR